jgi:hypothetical protein
VTILACISRENSCLLLISSYSKFTEGRGELGKRMYLAVHPNPLVVIYRMVGSCPAGTATDSTLDTAPHQLLMIPKTRKHQIHHQCAHRAIRFLPPYRCLQDKYTTDGLGRLYPVAPARAAVQTRHRVHQWSQARPESTRINPPVTHEYFLSTSTTMESSSTPGLRHQTTEHSPNKKDFGSYGYGDS